MMTSLVARVKFIKIKVVLGIITKPSQNKFHHIRITKPKVIHVQVPVPRRFFGLQNGASMGLQIGTDFRDYKTGQEGLQIGAALGISNRGKKITIRGKKISNQGRDYKLGQEGFHFRAGIANRCRTMGTLTVK